MDRDRGSEFLLILADVLDSLACPFFLIQGTALGAYRDRGFTPTEKDIDIGILQEHMNRHGLALLAELTKMGFDTECFIRPFTQPRTMVVYYTHGVKADIVGLARWKDKRFTAMPVRPWITTKYAFVHEARLLETYQQVELFGRIFNIPSPIEEYLQREYQDWRTPRDDNMNYSRIDNFLEKEAIPRDHLERQPSVG